MTPEEVKLARKDIDATIERLANWKKDLDKAISEMQQSCPHPVESLLEAPIYNNGMGESYYGYSGIVGPYRVCTLCGWAEEGTSFWKLGRYKYDVKETSVGGSAGVDELRKHVLGGIHSAHELYRLEYPERFNADGTEK